MKTYLAWYEGNGYGHHESFGGWYENFNLDDANTLTDLYQTVEYSNVLVSFNLADSTTAMHNKIIRYWLMDSGCTIHITHAMKISYHTNNM